MPKIPAAEKAGVVLVAPCLIPLVLFWALFGTRKKV